MEGDRDGTLKSGVEVYVFDTQQSWLEGTILSAVDTNYSVKTQSGKVVTVKHSDVLLRPAAALVTSNSLTELAPINKASVLSCLHKRFDSGVYYTGAGSTVVAVNPFCNVSHLYSTETALHYHCYYKESDPHIYQVGAEAYTRLVRELGQVNQSIIVSGESGAGKTVSAKHLVRYMALVSNPAISSRHGRVSIVGRSLERRIIDSNPILEAFGNAVTKRNDNSSRFGKYIQLQFSRAGLIQGGTVRTYLLEKTRVVHQALGECNFHIFYQLVNGVKENKISLSSMLDEQMKITAFSILPVGKDIDENRDIQLTLEAMTEIGLEPNVQRDVIKVVTAILFLGNIDFKAMEDEYSKMVEDDDDKFLDTTFMAMEVTEQALNMAASVLGVSPSQLERSFLYRNIVSGGQNRRSVFVKPVPQHEAYSRRDCLATVLYSRLFEWLVNFINSQIQAEEFDHTIGLLDIYGFEDFSENSLEQLCINYANEKLQQHYVKHFLKDLQGEYEEECISWNFTSYTDNQPCLDLLEGQPSVFGVLNEDVFLNRKSNSQTLCERVLALACHSKSYLRQPKKFHSNPGFTIHHYAGAVTYRGEGLTVKNRDNVPLELVYILQSSTNSFISELFKTLKVENSNRRKCKTVLGKFKSSLDELMLLLNKSDVHYIRCIKPNTTGQAGLFDRPFVMSQLVANGIIETVEISRQGYQGRMCYSDFLHRYGLIIRNAPTPPQSSDEDRKENEILYDPLDTLFKKQLELPDAPRRTPTPRKRLRRRAGLSSMDHTRRCCAAVMSIQFNNSHNLTQQFGKTKLFLHQSQIESLEARRLEILSRKAILIQQCWRWFKHRRERQRRVKAAAVIQSAWRKYLEKKRRNEALILIQKCVRALLARKKFQKKLLEVKQKKSNEKSWKPIMDRKRRSPAGQRNSSRRSKHRRSRHSTSNGSLSELDGTLEGSSFESESSRENLITVDDVVSHTTANTNKSNIDTADNIVSPSFLSADEKKKKVIGPLASYKAKAEKKKSAREPFMLQDGNINKTDCPPVKRMRTLDGCRTTLQDISMGNGIITRRRLPKVPIRFHTRQTALKNAHVVHHRELQCGIQDCLPENQSASLSQITNQSDDILD